ncbi:MAG: hypothetical protein ACOCUI_01830 [bacterium]
MGYKNINNFKSNEKNNILTPLLLCGNYIKIKETFLDDLLTELDNKKEYKYVLSLYIYLKIKVNETYNNKINPSIRSIAIDLNTSSSNIHKAIHKLKNMNTDLLIQINKNKTTVQLIPDMEASTNYIPLEKNTFKKLFKHGINAIMTYYFIYYQVHIKSSFTKGDDNTIIFNCKELSKHLKVNKDLLSKALIVLDEHNFINKQTKQKIGSIISLKKDYIEEKHIRNKIKIKSLNNKQKSDNKPIYQTNPNQLNLYSKQPNSQKVQSSTNSANSKKPLNKKTYTKKPITLRKNLRNSKATNKPEKEKVSLQESFNKNKSYENTSKKEYLINKIKILENKKEYLIKKFNLNPKLKGYETIASTYYDNKINVYKLHYKANKNNIKAFVQYGANVIDLDNYINDMRTNYKPDDEYYIYSRKKWKRAFIRDFNKRKRPDELSNYELRIKNYIKDYEITIQEKIPTELKLLSNELDKHSDVKNIIDKAFAFENEKSPFQQKVEKLINFKQQYQSKYWEINRSLQARIKAYKLNVSQEYFVDMFLNRVNEFLEQENKKEIEDIVFDKKKNLQPIVS